MVLRMVPNPLPKRRSLRLKEYNYAQAGAYFVTTCTQDRKCLFGDIVDDQMCLNDAGKMVERLWNDIPNRFPSVAIDIFVIMPNHLHGIVILPDGVTAPRAGASVEPGKTITINVPTLGDVMKAFKSSTTVEYIQGVKAMSWPAFHQKLWQRNYYDHVIRDGTDLDRVRRYIDENPVRWAFDDENPQKE
jgi:putative transposase